MMDIIIRLVIWFMSEALLNLTGLDQIASFCDFCEHRDILWQSQKIEETVTSAKPTGLI